MLLEILVTKLVQLTEIITEQVKCQKEKVEIYKSCELMAGAYRCTFITSCHVETEIMFFINPLPLPFVLSPQEKSAMLSAVIKIIFKIFF